MAPVAALAHAPHMQSARSSARSRERESMHAQASERERGARMHSHILRVWSRRCRNPHSPIRYAELKGQGTRPIGLGGDHSVTLAAVTALRSGVRQGDRPMDILLFDAVSG